MPEIVGWRKGETICVCTTGALNQEKKKLKASHTAQKVQLFEVSCTVNSARYGHL